MPPKRKSTAESEQKAKKQRNEAAAAAAAAMEPSQARAAQADVLVLETQFLQKQSAVCSKLAKLLGDGHIRPIEQRAADVFKLLEEDAQREQPLLTLSFELDVSHTTAEECKQCCR